MLCYTILCYTTLHYTTLQRYTILCYATLYYAPKALGSPRGGGGRPASPTRGVATVQAPGAGGDVREESRNKHFVLCMFRFLLRPPPHPREGRRAYCNLVVSVPCIFSRAAMPMTLLLAQERPASPTRCSGGKVRTSHSRERMCELYERPSNIDLNNCM